MRRNAPIRVVLADSHPVMLVTARHLLETEEDILVAASAVDLDGATAAVREHRADVLVADLSMLGTGARATVSDLAARLPDTAIVILTMEATPALVPALITAGARAYVLKEFAESELAEAVRRAVEGGPFISAKLAA